MATLHFICSLSLFFRLPSAKLKRTIFTRGRETVMDTQAPLGIPVMFWEGGSLSEAGGSVCVLARLKGAGPTLLRRLNCLGKTGFAYIVLS